jgi:HSP20 family protein
MFTRFGDFDRTLAFMDELRRRMDRVWDDFDSGVTPGVLASGSWPRMNVFDTGSNLTLKADVPGMSEKDLQITLHADSLSISGERKVDAPEGYSVHRQERNGVKFSRSLTLPCKVNAEQSAALVRDGVLTITLPKAPEAQPRKIAIRAQ